MNSELAKGSRLIKRLKNQHKANQSKANQSKNLYYPKMRSQPLRNQHNVHKMKMPTEKPSIASDTCSQLKEGHALARHPIFFSFFRGFQFLQIPSQKGRKEKYSFSLISRLLMETSISGPNLIWIMAGSLSFPRASRVSEAIAVLNYCQSVISQGSWGPLALVYILISSSRREKISLFPMCISNLPKQRIIYKGGDQQSELRNLGLMNTLCWPCW